MKAAVCAFYVSMVLPFASPASDWPQLLGPTSDAVYAGPAIAEKCGWQTYEIVRSLYKEDLQQLEYQHPFCNRTGKLLVGDNFVESSTGTGFVHIAPGHGLDDYNLGRANKLPIYSPVNDDGAFAHTNVGDSRLAHRKVVLIQRET